MAAAILSKIISTHAVEAVSEKMGAENVSLWQLIFGPRTYGWIVINSAGRQWNKVSYASEEEARDGVAKIRDQGLALGPKYYGFASFGDDFKYKRVRVS